MPVIVRFGGFVIRMYSNDHNPPHVHVENADFRALVAIKNCRIIEGNIDPKFRREALDWIAANIAMLMQRWEELQQ